MRFPCLKEKSWFWVSYDRPSPFLSPRGNLFSASLVSQVTSYIKPRSLGGCCLQFFHSPPFWVRLQNKDILKLGLSVMKLKNCGPGHLGSAELGGSYLRVLFRSVTGRQAAPPGCSHGCSDPSPGSSGRLSQCSQAFPSGRTWLLLWHPVRRLEISSLPWNVPTGLARIWNLESQSSSF